VSLCAFAAWRYLDFRRERLAEQTRFLHRREAGVAPPVVHLPPAPESAASSAYVEVAQKLLLSPDRNPDVIIDIVAPKPMPPLPRAYGAINFGQGPRVLLAEKSGGQQRSYTIGSKIGAFKVLAITQAGVVFDWEGKLVAARYREMRDLASAPTSEAASTGRSSPSALTAIGASAASQSSAAAEDRSQNLKSIGSTGDMRGKFGAGVGSYRACLKGDDSPEGTITDGFRKVVVPTPMGESCHWEKVE
jgi:hypothetical protein